MALLAPSSRYHREASSYQQHEREQAMTSAETAATAQRISSIPEVVPEVVDAVRSRAEGLTQQFSKEQLADAWEKMSGVRGDDARINKAMYALKLARLPDEAAVNAALLAAQAGEAHSAAKAAPMLGDEGAQLAALIQRLASGSVNEAKVREIVADAVKGISAPALTVKLALPSGEVKDLGKQHRQFPDLLTAINAGVFVWLTGPAGSGKTTAAEATAKALGLPFSFNGALDTGYKVTGFVDAAGRIVSTSFRKAYTEGGLHLFDECDASLAPATLAINAALANGYAEFPDGAVSRHPKFACIAAANTRGAGASFEYIGRNKMDDAFLDRFVQMQWHYDESLERHIAGNDEWTSYVQTARAKATAKGLKVVISPRASIFGARLLAAGMKRDDVITMTMRGKMTAEQWNTLGMPS